MAKTWAENYRPTEAGEAQRLTELTALVAKLEGYSPSASTCLVGVVRHVPATCSGMDEAERVRLAVNLANCHLERAGRQTYRCEPGDDIVRCTRGMTDAAFNAYTTFYAYTENMCAQIRHTVEVEETRNSLSALVYSTQVVVDAQTELKGGLDTIAARQDLLAVATDQVRRSVESVASLQAEELETLGRIHARTKEAVQGIDTISEGHAKLHKTLADLGGTALVSEERQRQLIEGQRLMLAEQEKLRAMNMETIAIVKSIYDTASILFGELFAAQTVCWYLGFLALVWASTSIKRTLPARSPAVLVLAFSLICERLLRSNGAAENSSLVVRYAFATLAFGCVLHALVRGKTNRAADELRALRKQLAEMQLAMATNKSLHFT